MKYEKNEKYLNSNNQESYESSLINNDCFINSNPIYNYMNINNTYLSNNNSLRNEHHMKLNNRKYKKHQFCNLNDPKLIDAYNEGYYGFNNIPKQYYIYPKFSKKENISKNMLKVNEQFVDEEINKEKSINNIDENKKNDNNDFVSSYISYPYPKLINISTNLFGSSHNIKSNFSNSNKNIINNDNEIQKDKNFSNNFSKNNEININDNNYECGSNEDSGNFYFINNTITTRNVPFENQPDNISIDDDDIDEY